MERTANSNPCTAGTATAQPTTYVQADAHTFRDLVQRLTGAESPDRLLPVTAPPRPPPASSVGPRRQAFKLQERRGPSVRNLEVQFGLTSLRSPRSPPPHLLHHFHHHHHPAAAIASPVTPLGSDPLFSPPPPASEEERAIADKGFYLHPSPRTTPRGSDPPELLPLFPLCSPKQQQSSSSDHE